VRNLPIQSSSDCKIDYEYIINIVTIFRMVRGCNDWQPSYGINPRRSS